MCARQSGSWKHASSHVDLHGRRLRHHLSKTSVLMVVGSLGFTQDGGLTDQAGYVSQAQLTYLFCYEDNSVASIVPMQSHYFYMRYFRATFG